MIDSPADRDDKIPGYDSINNVKKTDNVLTNKLNPFEAAPRQLSKVEKADVSILEPLSQ